MKDGQAVYVHQESHALIGGGQGLNRCLGQGAGLAAFQDLAVFCRPGRDLPPVQVPGAQFDIVAQEKMNLSGPIVQGKDLRLEMVLMLVAGKHIEGDPRRKRREFPFPPVEQQRSGSRLRQKAAVVQERDPHQWSLTAVP